MALLTSVAAESEMLVTVLGAKLAVSLGTVAEKDKEDFSLPLSSNDLGARLNGATQSIIASVSHSVL